MSTHDHQDHDDIVEISGSARARELRVDRRPVTRIATTGRGHLIVRRHGVPQTGAEEGVPYRDVELSIEIASDAPDTERER
ncbi:MAG: hypothetical protein ACTHU0_24375 [Kofleriaceae bacterium]